VSARSVQHVLSQHGTTFSDELLAMRLEAAFGMLKSGSSDPIADIAFKCGFSDLDFPSRVPQALRQDAECGARREVNLHIIGNKTKCPRQARASFIYHSGVRKARTQDLSGPIAIPDQRVSALSGMTE
jgi:hypothetical protein